MWEKTFSWGRESLRSLGACCNGRPASGEGEEAETEEEVDLRDALHHQALRPAPQDVEPRRRGDLRETQEGSLPTYALPKQEVRADGDEVVGHSHLRGCPPGQDE